MHIKAFEWMMVHNQLHCNEFMIEGEEKLEVIIWKVYSREQSRLTSDVILISDTGTLQ